MLAELKAFAGYVCPSIVALVLGAGLIWGATDGLSALTDEGARRVRIAKEAPALPVFALEDMYGETIELGSGDGAADQAMIVEFIYTSCPTVCQSSGAPYAQLRDRLAASGMRGRVRMLSVSFDPNNDDFDALQTYARLHQADGETWTVARIAPDDFAAVKKAFGLRIIKDEWGGYQHNVAMLVVNPAGELVRAFDNDDVDGVYAFLKATGDAR